MPTPVQLEARIQNAELYFANLMNKMVDNLGIADQDQAFVAKIDNLFYTIEAITFLVDRGIFTDNPTCLTVYQELMYQTGVYASNLTKDESLIIPEI